MNFNSILYSAVAIILSFCCHAQLVTYPGLPNNKLKSGKYSVRVKLGNGAYQNSYTYEYLKNAGTGSSNKNTVDPYNVVSANKRDILSNNHWTTVSYNNNGNALTFEVSLSGGNINTCEVYPKRYNLSKSVSGGKAYITVDQNEKYIYLVINNNKKDAMFLFVDPLETNIPNANTAGVKYFGPGLHEIGERWQLPGNIHTVYIAGGAYVRGTIEANNRSNITIRGRGILSGEGYNYRSGAPGIPWCAVHLPGNGTNQLIEGITSIKPLHFHFTSRGTMTVRHTKCFSYNNTTDGVVGGEETLCENSFFKVNDDVTKLYSDNMLFQDLVIYHQTNTPCFQFGWSGQSSRNCTIRRIDIVEDNHVVVGGGGIIGWASSNSSNNYQTGHVWTDVRADQGVSYIMDVNSGGSQGKVDITLNNFRISSTESKSELGGGNKKVTCNDVQVAGECVKTTEWKDANGRVIINCDGGGGGTGDCDMNVSASVTNATCESAGSVSLSISDFGTRSNIRYKVGSLAYSQNVGTSESYLVENLSPGTYDVFAEWGNAECPDTKVASITINDACNGGNIADVSDLTLSEVSCTSIKLTWTDVSGEDLYRIRRRLTGSPTYEILDDLPAGTNMYTDNSAQEQTSYEYMVRPMKDGVAVSVSNVPEITTSACDGGGDPQPGDCIEELKFPGGRIAFSSDGNQHDKDDWGATALSLAMVHAAGLGDKLVHYDHSNHIGDNNSAWEAKMIEAAEGGARRFGFDESAFFNDQKEAAAAAAHLAAEIDKSAADNILWLISAGPQEMVWRALNQSNANKHPYVHIISHSTWNENHDHGPSSHTWADMKRDFPNIKYHDIIDQNSSNGDDDFNGPYSKWSWMNTNSQPDWKWVYDLNDKNSFDVSDAGMTWWLLTGGPNGGDDRGGWRETKKLLENPCNGGGNGGGGNENPQDVTGLQAMVMGCGEIKLTWNDVDNETGFRVRRKLQSEDAYMNIGDVDAGVTSFTDFEVDKNTSYTYMVRPLVDGAAVALSNLVDITSDPCVITSVFDSENKDLMVYPNPASDKVNISSESAWSLYAVDGQLLRTGKGTVVDLQEQSGGFYILEVEGQKFRIVKK